MRQLYVSELRKIAMEARAMPPLSPCSKWKDQITCPICFQIKVDAMVIHELCRRIFCADCVVQMIDMKTENCGLCRGLIQDPTTWDGLSLFSRLSPAETWLLDNLQYACKECDIVLTYDQAKTHLNNCEKKPVFKPPQEIHDWDNIDLSIRPTVSNPVNGEPSKKRDRLLVYHYNGKQIDSRFINANWDIARLKLQIARITDTDANELQLYKFAHRELGNDEKVRDIAPFSGATHITATLKMDKLKTNTAIMSLHDIGPEPAKDTKKARGRA